MEEKADKKTLIITGLMILLLCALFFALGYGMDQQRKVNHANKAIIEFRENYPYLKDINSNPKSNN